MNPNVYPRDGKWYALTNQGGYYQEIGPYDTPTQAAINAQMIEDFHNTPPPSNQSSFPDSSPPF